MTIFSEPVERSFRAIHLAQPAFRRRVFEARAVEALHFAKVDGTDRTDVIDRLETIADFFGWPAEDRQRLLSAAVEQADSPKENDSQFGPDDPADVCDEEVIRAPEFSDEHIAQRFSDSHPDLRYVAALGRWFIWDGIKWRADEILKVRHLVRITCCLVAAQCKQEKVAKAIASAKTVGNVERLAQADPRQAANLAQFDADPFTLNTPTGIFNLRTGEVLQHDPRAYLTKVTGVAPDFDMPTPTWNAFLKRAMGGDSEAIAYLRRMAGYAITGSTQEHALFFLYGMGANGKSTFLNAITAAAGDYHKVAAIETFTSSSHDRHPTDLAGLRGARVVTAVETEEGRRWAESRIKSLTGGDKIAARFMRQDFFEFTPQFKLLIAGNHKPGLRSVDEAIRRRFNLIPFNVTIPPEERDPELGQKIAVELPGILAWMITGTPEWVEHGLAPPPIITAATAAYLDSEDAVAAWIDELAEREPNSFSKTADLFASWSVWADKAGEYVGSSKRFAQALETRGFTPHRHYQLGRGFRGIRLADGPMPPALS